MSKHYPCLTVFLTLIALGSPSLAQPKKPNPYVPDHVQQHLDVVYANYGNREMHLDLFVPTKGPCPKPAIVIVHGGGWLKGDKSKFRPLAQALAARGYVSAAIEYRLGGEAKFPAAIHDCNAAVRWLRANAKKHSIDPDRIGAVGGSAGGHLVGLMATGSHVKQLQGDGGNSDQSSAIQAAVVMAGPLELATGPVAEKSRNDPENSNSNQWIGKTVDEAPELYKLASATTHITKDAPPILFMTGEFDNPQRNVATRRKLKSLGIPTEIKVYKNGKHGCWNREPWFSPMVDDVDKFFAESFSYRLSFSNELDSEALTVAGKMGWMTWKSKYWANDVSDSNRLEVKVNQSPANDSITLPRLNNRIGKVFLKNDPKAKPLTLKPGTDTWSITLPKSSQNVTVSVELVERVYLPTIPRVVSANADASVTLAAHDSVTHGQLIRYEPQPHKNTVGYWANEKDWCEWHFYLDEPGSFDLHILQGCGKGQGDSEVAVTVGKQTVEFVVEDTGHFQNFKDRKIGRVELAGPGLYTLQIRAKKKAAKAVMDVRQVRLTPAKENAEH